MSKPSITIRELQPCNGHTVFRMGAGKTIRYFSYSIRGKYFKTLTELKKQLAKKRDGYYVKE